MDVTYRCPPLAERELSPQVAALRALAAKADIFVEPFRCAIRVRSHCRIVALYYRASTACHIH